MAQVVLVVKFTSELSLDEVMEIARSRADEFRALEGLEQKYYFRDTATGQIGGLYIWKTPEDLAAYRKSELRKTIAAAYKTVGEPDLQVLEVLMPLRD